MVTSLLERAFAQASELSKQEQDLIAAWILAELASERCWTEAFSASQDAVAHLADEALAEYHESRTQVLCPRRL